MAIETLIWGFESKDPSTLANSSSVSGSLTAVAARSGAVGFDRSASRFAVTSGPSALMSGGVPFATLWDWKARVHFLIVSYPGVTDWVVASSSDGVVSLQMNTSGQVRLNTLGTANPVTYSTSSLNLGVWYRADFRVYGYSGDQFTCGRRKDTCTIYDANGVVVMQLRTKTQSENTSNTAYHGANNQGTCAPNWYEEWTMSVGTLGINAGWITCQLFGGVGPGLADSEYHCFVRCGSFMSPVLQQFVEGGTFTLFNEPFQNFFLQQGVPTISGLICGDSSANAGHGNGTHHIYYDDIWCEFRTGSDVHGNDPWPYQTRIYGFVPTAQGTNDGFTPSGAYDRVADLPDVNTYVSTTTIGALTSYRHGTVLPTDTIVHIKLVGNVWSSPTGTHSFYIGATEYQITNITTSSNGANASTPVVNVRMIDSPMTAGQFSGTEIGAKHGPAANEFRIYNLFFEVLSGPPAADTSNEIVIPPSGSVPGVGGPLGTGGGGPDVGIGANVGTYLVWAEFTDSLGVVHPWSNVPLPDPYLYYWGYKDEYVSEWGRLVRSLSDDHGVPIGIEFDITLIDTRRIIRGLLADPNTRYFKNRNWIIRTIDDANRRLLRKPRVIMRGATSEYQPLAPLKFSFKIQDLITRKFTGQVNAQLLPELVLDAVDFPKILTVADPKFPNVKVTAGLAAPIVFGNVSDTNVTMVPGPDAGVLILDLTAPVVPRATLNGLAGSVAWQLGNPDPTKRPVYVWIIVKRNGLGGPATNSPPQGLFLSTQGWLFGNPPDPLSSTGVKVSWNQAAEAQGYRIFFADSLDFDPYGSKGTATKARYIDHDATTLDGYYTGWDFSTDLTDWTIGTDALTGGTTWITKDTGTGVYAPLYAGVTLISTIPYHTFVISCHACKSIDEMYTEGSAMNLQTDASVAGASGPWLVPGFAGWIAKIGSAKYLDINGHRYTIIYGLQGAVLPDRAAGVIPTITNGAVPFSISVKGIETIGDGTGDLITSAFDIYKHIMINFVLQSYQTGNWLSVPAFEDDPLTPQIDAASFTAAQAVAATRIAGGYVAAGVIGEKGEQISAVELITRFNISCDCDSGYNRKCQFMVSMYDDSSAAIATATKIDNIFDIVKDSFDEKDDDQVHYTIAKFLWSRLYTDKPAIEDGWMGSRTAEEIAAIANYSTSTFDARLPMPDLKLYFVRDVAIAVDIVQRKLSRHKNPPRRAKFTVPWSGFNRELGDLLSVTHYGGVGAAGYFQQPMRLLTHSANPNSYLIDFECWVLPTPIYSLGGTPAIDPSDPLAVAFGPIPNSPYDMRRFEPLVSKFPLLGAFTRRSKESGVGPKDVYGALDVTIDGSNQVGITYQAVVHCRTDRSYVTITPSVKNITSGATAATGVACSEADLDYSAANQTQTLTLTIAPGVNTYRLQYTLSALGQGSTWMDGTIIRKSV